MSLKKIVEVRACCRRWTNKCQTCAAVCGVCLLIRHPSRCYKSTVAKRASIAVRKENPTGNGSKLQTGNPVRSLGMHVIHCGSSYGEPNPPRCMNYLKSFSFVTNSCAIMPAVEIMARRPLRISLFCSSKNAAGSVGLRPRGSKPRSPGTRSSFIVQ